MSLRVSADETTFRTSGCSVRMFLDESVSVDERNDRMTRTPKIVILGGGFGGLYAAMPLQRELAGSDLA